MGTIHPCRAARIVTCNFLVSFGMLLSCFGSLLLLLWCHPSRIWMPKLLQMYLNSIVVLGFDVWPTAAVCADHVSSVANSTEVKRVALALYNFLMTHANGNPIRRRFPDFETKHFDRSSLLQTGLHHRELIPRDIGWLGDSIWKKLYISMLARRRELILRRLPYIHCLDMFLELCLVA